MSDLKKFEISQRDYRAMEGLSSSDIKILLDNPYFFINKQEQEYSNSLTLGSLFHSIVLEYEKLNENYIVSACADKRTKEYKELKEEADKQGKEIIDATLWTRANEMLESLKQTKIYGLIKNGIKEFSFTREIDGMLFKCRPDSYLEKEGVIFDLKTTSLKNGASPSEFLKSVANYKYYIQAALYLSVLQAKEFYFVVIEAFAPYMIGIYKLDAQSLEFGNEKIKEAVEVYKSLDKYRKNFYLSKERELVQTLTLPNWVYYQ